MEKRADDSSFENAWDNQFNEEKKEKAPAEKKEVKIHAKPSFRGQRDVEDNRSEIKMATKQTPAPEKKHVEVLAEPTSKEGDDFDVEW